MKTNILLIQMKNTNSLCPTFIPNVGIYYCLWDGCYLAEWCNVWEFGNKVSIAQ